LTTASDDIVAEPSDEEHEEIDPTITKPAVAHQPIGSMFS